MALSFWYLWEMNFLPSPGLRTPFLLFFAFIFTGLLWTCPVRGQGPGDSIQPSLWWPEVQKVDEMLRAGRYKKGEKQARKLGEEVIGKSWYGAELKEVLAEVALLRAVAEANLGLRREALWHWHVAQNIDFRIARKDLSPYGDAAKLLLEFPLRDRGEMPPGFENRRPLPGQRVERPEKAGFDPVTILNNTGASIERPGGFEAEVVLDAAGLLQHPVVVSVHHNPVIKYAVLEWMFELPPFVPARIEGEPIDFLLALHVQFHFIRW